MSRGARWHQDVATVWLTATPRTLAARFFAQGHRPAYGDDPETFLGEQLARRAPLFRSVRPLEVDVETGHPTPPPGPSWRHSPRPVTGR